MVFIVKDIVKGYLNVLIVEALSRYRATFSEGISDGRIATNGISAVVIRWKTAGFMDDAMPDVRGK